MGIFGGKKKTVSYTAPMIGSFRVQTSIYGRCITLLWGRTRISGNLIWAGAFKAIPHTSQTSGGGKGGGGGSVSTQTTYTYEMAVIIGLCSGPIENIGTVWKDKEKISWPGGWEPGDRPPEVWGWLQSNFPAEALGYSGLALVHDENSDLGESGTLPTFSFEIFGRLPFNAEEDIWETNPKEFLLDFLTNAFYGVGFPAELIAPLTQFSNFCVASGIFLSPALEDQSEAQEILKKLCLLTNSAPVWIDGKLDLIPLADEQISGNGATFVPDNTPVYDLNDADFYYEEGEDPLAFLPADPADAFNQVKMEYLDKANDYNVAVADPSDLAAVMAYGLRPADTIEAHWITDSATAWKVARLILQGYQFAGGKFKFRLTQKHILLTVMDLVTLTDSILGLNNYPARIKSLNEDDQGVLSVEAEPYLAGVAGAALYPHQGGAGFNPDFNVDPGNLNDLLILEPPPILTLKGFEVWIAACGGENWGGCQIWLSLDDVTYQRLGRITAPARLGGLTASLPGGSDPDETNTLAVDLSESQGELLSASQEEVDDLATLCYVDGELVAYRDAELTEAYKYDLTYLRRGCHGTAIGEHAISSLFCRLDPRALFRYPFNAEDIGKNISLKFLSYNIYGGAMQGLGDVEAKQYTLGGGPLKADIPDLTNFTDYYLDGKLRLKCDEVDDPFQGYRILDYEVRKGESWALSSVLGRFKNADFPTQGDGTYWVAAHCYGSYSPNPASLAITNANLPDNVVATFDEYADGWPGTMSGGVFEDAYGNLQIAG